MRAAPNGMQWASNGPYLELMTMQNVPHGSAMVSPDTLILQVLLADVTKPDDRESCIYLFRDAAIRLLHMPPHVFGVLAAHYHHHHIDRHFATHVASFRRKSGWC